MVRYKPGSLRDTVNPKSDHLYLYTTHLQKKIGLEANIMLTKLGFLFT